MRRDVRILLVGDGVCLSRRDVSQWVLRLLLLAPRGCREEHHSHLAHQGILRSACTSVYLTRAHSTLTWRGRPPQFSRSVLHPPAVQVQHIVPEVTIPPEVTPENVTTYIVDSGSACPALSLSACYLYSPASNHVKYAAVSFGTCVSAAVDFGCRGRGGWRVCRAPISEFCLD